MFTHLPKIPLQKIDDDIFKQKQIQVYLLRLDLTDQFISGNKWFKLKYNLLEAKNSNYDTLLTFGGAFSNHIHATAAAAKANGFSSIGIIRGEAYTPLNQTLSDATNMGMHLHYINRKKYREKKHADFLSSIIKHFQNDYGKIYVIPEGGSNSLAVKGASEILSLIPIDFQYLCLACGTGGTLAGISSAIFNIDNSDYKDNVIKLIGFPALKGAQFLNNDINQLLKQYQKLLNKYQKLRQYPQDIPFNWQLNVDYHFGGFAKNTPQLLSFIEAFYQQHQIELDFVYSGKMMYGIYDLCKKDYFKAHTTVVAIHTGGLQGNRSAKLVF